MATTVKELKATARPSVGKGAARAERRAGRVPGVIYGNNQPPQPISVDDRELRQRILAGRFLTTIYDIDLGGKKHRVIPRDFHLDPVRDVPLHVDFLRLGIGHPGIKELVHSYVLADFAKDDGPWVTALCQAVADSAGLIASGRDSTFQNKVHLTMQAKGFFDQVDDGKE